MKFRIGEGRKILLNIMSKYDLSILIPSRNEVFLKNTIDDILKNIEGKTEVIAALDGAWASPQIEDDPRVTLIYFPESIGQRAATNQACRLSKAKYVMKIDAHCAFDKGFDVKMMSVMQDDWTLVPALYNLHVFDWRCKKCGNTWYQGPTPKHCKVSEHEANPNCDSQDFEKVIVWKPRLNRRSEFYRFDHTLHFQYWGAFKNRPEAKGDIAPSMSIQGSCFMLTREKYWELDICGEEHGSWGQQGTEVACKTWLSGGRMVCGLGRRRRSRPADHPFKPKKYLEFSCEMCGGREKSPSHIALAELGGAA